MNDAPSGQQVRVAAARGLVPVLTAKGSLSSFDDSQVPPRDRAFLRALCYGVCRTLPRLEALAQELLRSPFKLRDMDVHALLLLGIYQLLYLRVPAHAAVGETAGAAKRLNKPWATAVLNGCLRRLQRESDTLQARVDRDTGVALLHPAWILKMLRRDWPEQWRDIAEANNQLGPMTLRVNRRLISRNEYLQCLEAVGKAATPCAHSDDGLTLATPCDIAELPGFSDGQVSVQDEAAQLASALLGPALVGHQNARVLDACCAPGGKTAHLLEAYDIDMLAIDSDATRLTRVETTLERLGLQAELRHADASGVDWWDGVPFQAILLDAPCSGTGVIRRHPDIKQLRRASDIHDLAALQSRLLDALWQTLAPGGTLLYATCSVMCEENAKVIEAFLARTTDAQATTPSDVAWGQPSGAGRQLLPQLGGHDGFFYARLVKQAG